MTVAQLKERMDARFKSVDRRFDAVDSRFDAVDRRFDAVDRRFDALEAHFRRRFLSLESLGQQVAANKRSMKEGFDHHTKVLNEHDARITDLEPPRA